MARNPASRLYLIHQEQHMSLLIAVNSSSTVPAPSTKIFGDGALGMDTPCRVIGPHIAFASPSSTVREDIVASACSPEPSNPDSCHSSKASPPVSAILFQHIQPCLSDMTPPCTHPFGRVRAPLRMHPRGTDDWKEKRSGTKKPA